MNESSIPRGAVTINVSNKIEYQAVVEQYKTRGFRFSPCDDLRRLFWGSLGFLDDVEPMVWVRLPILQITGDDLSEIAPGDFIIENSEELGNPVEERFVTLADYHREFSSHRDEQHHIVEATDPLCFRLAFVCTTCRELVRVDWDECIELGRVLDESVQNTDPNQLVYGRAE
jgi:hypothetical protein